MGYDFDCHVPFIIGNPVKNSNQRNKSTITKNHTKSKASCRGIQLPSLKCCFVLLSLCVKLMNCYRNKYNYEENDLKVWLMKPSADTRDGVQILRSRIGLQAQVQVLQPGQLSLPVQ